MAAGLNHVTIVEVGPRDGLQNEPGIIPTPAKIAFIDALSAAGLPVIEATSFVSPKAVPQLADAGEVMRAIRRRPGVRYPVLIPNERGYDRAVAANVDAIALFTSATEAFCQANIRCSIDEAFERFEPVVERAKRDHVWIRGYVSVAFDCPYSGPVEPELAIAVAERLFAIGCDEVSIADTLGTAKMEGVEAVIALAKNRLPLERIALHFHDTYGRAVANIERAYDLGIRIFDSAAGGFGGCPFAPGASGNVPTESVVRAFELRGIPTGIDVATVERAVADVMGARIDDNHSLE
jgi:hydroxymethylglutaryl-CoA lyase